MWRFNTRDPLDTIPDTLWETPFTTSLGGVTGHCASLTPIEAAAEYLEYHCPACLALLQNLSYEKHKEAS